MIHALSDGVHGYREVQFEWARFRRRRRRRVSSYRQYHYTDVQAEADDDGDADARHSPNIIETLFRTCLNGSLHSYVSDELQTFNQIPACRVRAAQVRVHHACLCPYNACTFSDAFVCIVSCLSYRTSPIDTPHENMCILKADVLPRTHTDNFMLDLLQDQAAFVRFGPHHEQRFKWICVD